MSIDEFSRGRYTSIPSIPPPSAPRIAEKAKEIAIKHYTYQNPTDVHLLRRYMKQAVVGHSFGSGSESGSGSDSVRNSNKVVSNRVVDFLSTYPRTAPPYTDRIVRFIPPTPQQLSIWVSSTKNSDHTISYWVLYPVHDQHIRAAVLNLMNVSLNGENLGEVSSRFPALYGQVKSMLHNETVKCEQVDPLYVNHIVRSLSAQNYKPISSQISDKFS